MRKLLLIPVSIVALCSAGDALAQATSMDNVPIAWGETDERNATVCAKRWHAIKIRDIRTQAVDLGLGAEAQVQMESKAVFSGAADCFTGQVTYRPVLHADVVLGARTWVQLPERDGPVLCFGDKRCRWAIQEQSFVEAEVEVDGKSLPGTVYVATPRPVQPARLGAPAPAETGNDAALPPKTN